MFANQFQCLKLEAAKDLFSAVEAGVTRLGSQLATKGRWETYWLNPAALQLPDMNLADHARRTADQGLRLGGSGENAGQFTAAESWALKTMGLIHDLGELGDGDLNWSSQQDPGLVAQARERERAYFKANFRQWFPEVIDRDATYLQGLYDLACPPRDAATINRRPPGAVRLEQSFHSVEVLGYLLAALDHFLLAKEYVAWGAMVASVFVHRGPWLDDILTRQPEISRFMAPEVPRIIKVIDSVERNPADTLAWIAQENKILRRTNPNARQIQPDFHRWRGIVEKIRVAAGGN